MPCLRADHHRLNIIGEDKFLIVGTIEDKKKLMFGMIARKAFQDFVTEAADAFQFSF
jgi:hypothetical protein